MFVEDYGCTIEVSELSSDTDVKERVRVYNVLAQDQLKAINTDDWWYTVVKFVKNSKSYAEIVFDYDAMNLFVFKVRRPALTKTKYKVKMINQTIEMLNHDNEMFWADFAGVNSKIRRSDIKNLLIDKSAKFMAMFG